MTGQHVGIISCSLVLYFPVMNGFFTLFSLCLGYYLLSRHIWQFGNNLMLVHMHGPSPLLYSSALVSLMPLRSRSWNFFSFIPFSFFNNLFIVHQNGDFSRAISLLVFSLSPSRLWKWYLQRPTMLLGCFVVTFGAESQTLRCLQRSDRFQLGML